MLRERRRQGPGGGLLGWAWCLAGLSRGDSSSPAVASSSPALSPLLLMRLFDWLRVYLRGLMTDVCSTNLTQKGMGLGKKGLVREKEILHHEDPSVAISVDSRLFQEL